MSETFGPFDVRPGVLERSTNLMDLVVRHRPDTTGLRLWGATSLENAYGTLVGSGLTGNDGFVLLEARAGGLAQSPLVVRRGWRVEENRRGQTSFQYDPNESHGHDLHFSDDTLLYCRVQEQRVGNWLTVSGPINTGYNIRGPILIVPPAQFFYASASVLSMQALAPMNTGCVAGAPPVLSYDVQTALPLHIVFPRPAATVCVTNQSDGDAMLVSFGLGMPMIVVGAGAQTVPTGGGYAQPGVRELVIAADPTAGAAVSFTIEATIGMELR